jgi:hypothetical protein
MVASSMAQLKTLRHTNLQKSLVEQFQSRAVAGIKYPIEVREFEKKINTTVGGRSLCQKCFANTFDMLKPNCSTLSRNNGTYKTTWTSARKRFCQTGSMEGTGDLDQPVKIDRHGTLRQRIEGVQNNAFSEKETRMLHWLYSYACRGYGERSPLDGAFHMQYCTRSQICKLYEQRCIDTGEDLMSVCTAPIHNIATSNPL